MFTDPLGADQETGTPDDDYRLVAGSPAIDAGDDGFLLRDTADLDRDSVIDEAVPVDLSFAVRSYSISSGEPTVDMGVFEYAAPPVQLRKESADPRPTVEYPFPNPSTGETTLPLLLAKQAEVSVELYDVLGRRVKEVARGSYPPGRHFVAINSASLAGGTYFIRVSIVTDGNEQLTAGRRFVVGR